MYNGRRQRIESLCVQSEHGRQRLTDHTILWVTRGLGGRQKRKNVFNTMDMNVLHADELGLSLGQAEVTDIDIVLVEASGIMKHDIDLCRRLRGLFHAPLLCITADISEAFAAAAYEVGVDECISDHISEELLRAKIRAHLRLIERISSQPNLCCC